MKDTFNIKTLTLLIAISTTITACSNKNSLSSETLHGNWKIQAINNKPVNNSTAYLNFNKENKMSGSASCNNLSSSYSTKDNTLTIFPIATTRKMCSSDLMEQEARLLQSLNKVKLFELDNGQLSLYDQQGQLQVKAKRTKEKPSKYVIPKR
jgi:heat shock protein HslJ